MYFKKTSSRLEHLLLGVKIQVQTKDTAHRIFDHESSLQLAAQITESGRSVQVENSFTNTTSLTLNLVEFAWTRFSDKILHKRSRYPDREDLIGNDC